MDPGSTDQHKPRASGRPTVRVVVADDQEMVRSGLRLMIDRRPGMRVVAEAADGEAAVAAAQDQHPDVVLMDVRMPGVDGVEATRRILRQWTSHLPKPRVIILTTFDLDEYVYAALRAGASGFLLKNCTPGQLIDAISVVAAGEAMLAPSVTQRLVHAFARIAPAPTPATAPDQAGLDTLTARELDVLRLVATGLSNAQIADRLGVTEANVKSRVNRILTRLGLDNRVQAAIVAYSHGLLPLP
ncbi:response regulator transcription factor [Micromonospora sp. CPCC 206061]|uniref:response regulator transcription factor n=1 Tax=Micromonospora sp. CPCC 206061 TaxID=3122410 RepID=UPI002FF37616